MSILKMGVIQNEVIVETPFQLNLILTLVLGILGYFGLENFWDSVLCC